MFFLRCVEVMAYTVEPLLKNSPKNILIIRALKLVQYLSSIPPPSYPQLIWGTKGVALYWHHSPTVHYLVWRHQATHPIVRDTGYTDRKIELVSMVVLWYALIELWQARRLQKIQLTKQCKLYCAHKYMKTYLITQPHIHKTAHQYSWR